MRENAPETEFRPYTLLTTGDPARFLQLSFFLQSRQ